MRNRTVILKRTLTAALLFLITFPIAFVFTGCGDDGDSNTEPETLSGIYQMQKVVTAADYMIGEIIIIPSGTDITEMAAAGILTAAPCSNPANAAVDLRDDGSLLHAVAHESARRALLRLGPRGPHRLCGARAGHRAGALQNSGRSRRGDSCRGR